MDDSTIRANISRLRRRIRKEKLRLQRLKGPRFIKKISIRRDVSFISHDQ
jgi:hypothetical protein